ncbi:hypothetical protein ACFYRC_20375 [Streptomyces sp. NPDC005279]
MPIDSHSQRDDAFPALPLRIPESQNTAEKRRTARPAHHEGMDDAA